MHMFKFCCLQNTLVLTGSCMKNMSFYAIMLTRNFFRLSSGLRELEVTF